MPCKSTNAPINLTSTLNAPCDKKCNFVYNYGSSSCSVTNMHDYLDIQCFDGNNTIKMDMLPGNLIPTSVRLYAPSLNTYDGVQAHAELIITHQNPGGRALFVCIPIISSEIDSSSAVWFSKFIKTVPVSIEDKKKSPSVWSHPSKNINVYNFTLNDVMPQSGFTVYENGTFDWACGTDNVIILFNKSSPTSTIKDDDYRTLRSLIVKKTMSIYSPASTLLFNKTGTTGGSGSGGGGSGKTGKEMTCEPITYPDGTPIVPGNPKALPWVDNGGDDPFGKGMAAVPWFLTMAVVFGIILLMGGAFYLVTWIRRRARTAAAEVARGGGSTGT